MKIIPLFSGSNGNCTLVKSNNTSVLIDAGVSVPKILAALKTRGESFESLSAVVLTHSHQDHVKGMQRLVFQKPHMKVYGGADVEKFALCTGFEQIKAGSVFEVGDIQIKCFPVPHDVPCFGYTFENGVDKVGYATDIGEVTSQTISHLIGSGTVMIESNYDDTLLAKGEYPIYLKRRISSLHGHLSNNQAKEAVLKLLGHGTRNFILAHLSAQNNTPEMAYKETQNHLKQNGATLFSDYTLHVAKRFGIDEEIT